MIKTPIKIPKLPTKEQLKKLAVNLNKVVQQQNL